MHDCFRRHLLGLLCALTMFQTEPGAEVIVRSRPAPRAIRAVDYEAQVDWDGCLTNLRIGGREFLAPGVSISRGSYFFQGGPLELSAIDAPAANIVMASSESAAVRYEFADHGMKWLLTNRSPQPMVFFLVLSAEVEAVRDTAGKLVMPPLNEDQTTLVCFQGDRALEIEGLNRVWGPWQGPHQVGQVDLEPGAHRELAFRCLRTSAEERSQMTALVTPPPETNLTVRSPRPYQVIQRRTVDAGEVLVSGHCRTDVDAVEFRVTKDGFAGTWQALRIVSPLGKFQHWTTLPAGGWYTLHVRGTKSGRSVVEADVDKFGVGEVFVGAGQSNSTNCGQFPTRQASGMVSSFAGEHWQLADDPQPGAADKSQGGSFWPAFGDAMFAKYDVPIGVAVTGYGGTSINQWQPDDDLFAGMMTRIHQLGPAGFRAVLWHQGESDAAMAADEYYAKLKHTIVASTAKAGWEFPWFVAQASYHSAEHPRHDNVRGAQARLWKDGVALAGPDTDTLTGDHRDFDGTGIHFSPKGLKAHGKMWAEHVQVYLDDVLRGKSGLGALTPSPPRHAAALAEEVGRTR